MSKFDETHEAEAIDAADVVRAEPAVDDTVAEPAVDDAVADAPDSADVTAEQHWTRIDVAAEPEAALEAAQRAVAAGECIVLPTDTVYGIGVGAFSGEAVTRLLEAKRRGRDMPPPVLIAEPAMLGALATSVSAWATSLAEAHWPGPLTLILTAHPSLHMDLGDTRGTIAVRVPDHEFTRELLRRTGPLAVSSANTSGNPASTNIDDAIDQLGDSVSVYLDAGPTRDDAPSTIVDFSSTSVGQIVRNGAIPFEVLREAAPHLVGIPIPDVDEDPSEDTVAADEGEATEDAESTPVVVEAEESEHGAEAEKSVAESADEAAAYAAAGDGAPSDPDVEPGESRSGPETE